MSRRVSTTVRLVKMTAFFSEQALGNRVDERDALKHLTEFHIKPYRDPIRLQQQQQKVNVGQELHAMCHCNIQTFTG